MMTGVIYARYSSDNQREESIEGQLRECMAYAERNGITVIGNYIDRAMSARTADRPDFQRMINDSEKKLFDVIIVWKLDRFSRDRYDSATYKHILKKNGVKVISATENIADSPEGILLESLLEGLSEYYSAELAVKIQRGQTENALKGRNNGGTIPMGFRRGADGVLELDPSTAPIVQEIFRRYDNGESLTSIVDYLNKQGVRTSKGKPFRIGSMETVLKTGSISVNIAMVRSSSPASCLSSLTKHNSTGYSSGWKQPSRSCKSESHVGISSDHQIVLRQMRTNAGR